MILFKNKIFFLLFVILVSTPVLSQNREQKSADNYKLTLKDILEIATKSSLDAYKAEQELGANYWQFRSFKASLLPKINLEFEPLTYTKSVSKRYDSENNIDVYRPQENLNSFANFAINQNIKLTGATMYINSSISRLKNFGEISSLDFNATPIRFGIIQPIMSYNEFKWQNRISPMEFERSKRNYIYQIQEINLKALTYFFNWALAAKKSDLANENLSTSIKLYNIGKKRYELGSIERDDLLSLELDQYNSQTSLTQTHKELEKALLELRLFLRSEFAEDIQPELPELISDLKIDVNDAILQAEINNPEIYNLKIKKIESERDLDKVIKENRFDLSLIASYGLNQSSESLENAYKDLLEQQMISIHLNIPLLDWGERKGNIKTARMNKEVNEIAIQQETQKLKQELLLKVADFNLQQEIVSGSLRSSEISKSAYDITEKRFLLGSVDILRLTSARKTWQLACENYITNLYAYWKFFYEVQRFTLYDFSNQISLSGSFEQMIDKKF